MLLKQRVLSSIGLWGTLLLVLLIFKVHGAVFFVGLFALMAQYEFSYLLKSSKKQRIFDVTLAGSFIAAYAQLAPNTWTDLLYALALILICNWSVFVGKTAVSFLTSLFCFWYITLNFHFFLKILDLFQWECYPGLMMVIWIVLVTKLTDVGGYDIYAVFTGSNELNTSREYTSLTVRPRLYTVTFDSDGGSTTDPQYVEDGGTIQKPDAPTRQDHRFTGWTDENGIPYDFSTTVTSPVELTAAWEWSKSETGVGIQWVSAGNPDAKENGSPIRMGDTVSVTASVELAAPSNAFSLSLPAFEFYVGDPDNGGTSLGTVNAQQTEGGYTASLDVELTNGNGFTKAGTYTIYAVFSGSGELDGSRSSHGLEVAPAIYTVTFDSNDGSTITPQIVVSGGRAIKPTNPTKAGHAFENWYSDSGLNTPYDFDSGTITAATTIYAKWTVNSYNVTLNTNGGTVNEGNVTGYVYGEGAKLPTDVTREGYTFGGWYDNEALSGSRVTVITGTDTGDKTYWAKWTASGSAPPKTGDDSHTGLWLSLMLLSLGGLAALGLARRRSMR